MPAGSTPVFMARAAGVSDQPGLQRSCMERLQIRFHGRVQGVGFRATARAVAAGIPVSGWVRNEEGGSVLMEVQGAGAAVESFLAALRSRFRGHIDAEDVAPMAVVEEETRFE